MLKCEATLLNVILVGGLFRHSTGSLQSILGKTAQTKSVCLAAMQCVHVCICAYTCMLICKCELEKENVPDNLTSVGVKHTVGTI